MIEDSMASYEIHSDENQRGDFLGYLRNAQAKDPERYPDLEFVSVFATNL